MSKNDCPGFRWVKCKACMRGFTKAEPPHDCCEECDGERGWYVPESTVAWLWREIVSRAPKISH